MEIMYLPDFDHNSAYIPLTTGQIGGIHQSTGYLLRIATLSLSQQLGQLLVAHHMPETVGTQEYEIAHGYIALEKINMNEAVLPEVAVVSISFRAIVYFIRQQEMDLDQISSQCVIGSYAP